MEKISEELKLIPSMREDYYVDIGWLNDQRTKLKSQYEKINEIYLRNQNGRIANEKILPELIQLKESFFSFFLMAQEINDHHSILNQRLMLSVKLLIFLLLILNDSAKINKK
ncbi:hypothetical protein SNEBB_009353 [Seison nebaliae]|nr:hypothetical protein SNEBB_009353 [Seison nebaliae]